MSETRFQRLEDKVDGVKTDVVELKVKLDTHMDKIEEHIAGDKKIITEISPLLSKLPGLVEIIEEHSFAKRKKREAQEKLKSVSMKLGIVSVCVGIIVGITRLF